jgi:hypothetical protein
MSSTTKYSKELIQLRRSKLLEYMAQAIPQHEAAQRLGVSPATVSLDLQYLRCAAQQNLKTHIEERIPVQFEECQAGLKLILRKAYHIVETSTRPQEVIAAMSLAVEIYSKLMDLSTNGAILEKTTKWLAEKKQDQDQEKKKETQLEQEQEQELTEEE